MSDIYFDSGVVVDALSGHPKAVAELRRVKRPWLCRVSWLEILGEAPPAARGAEAAADAAATALAVSIAPDSWRGEHVRNNTFAAAADLLVGREQIREGCAPRPQDRVLVVDRVDREPAQPVAAHPEHAPVIGGDARSPTISMQNLQTRTGHPTSGRSRLHGRDSVANAGGAKKSQTARPNDSNLSQICGISKRPQRQRKEGRKSCPEAFSAPYGPLRTPCRASARNISRTSPPRHHSPWRRRADPCGS